MFPGRLLSIFIFAEDDHRRTVGLDPAAIGGKGPLVGPTINPGGVIREQSETTVAGGISGQVILVEGNSPLVVEVKIPGQQPLIVDGTACRLRFPVGVIESRWRRRRFLSAAGRAPAHEIAILVGAESLDAERNEDQFWNLVDSLYSMWKRRDSGQIVNLFRNDKREACAKMLGIEAVQLEQSRHFFLPDFRPQLREKFPPFSSFDYNGAVSDGHGVGRFGTND